MSRNYHELLPYAFKKFSVLQARKTAVPTLLHWARRKPLEKSDKPALFTMNIMPPLMTVWYHLVQKNLGDNVDTVIFDCSGTLNPKNFPRARVQKYLNLYAATKSDEFLYHIATHRKIGWICDDDMFITSEKCLDRIEKEFSEPKTAALSFRPRNWWHFEMNGNEYAPCGSYCLVINREIYCEREHLSLSPADGNTHAVSHIGKAVKRYDTFDKANFKLLQKGYRLAQVPEKEQPNYFAGFSGVSSAAMLLWHFRTADQFLEYLNTPEDRSWSGNTLFTVLSGLLAIRSCMDMHHTITGKQYTLRSMPNNDDLMKLVEEKQPLTRKTQRFDATLKVANQLKTLL